MVFSNALTLSRSDRCNQIIEIIEIVEKSSPEFKTGVPIFFLMSLARHNLPPICVYRGNILSR